jgi:hypothetical protein
VLEAQRRDAARDLRAVREGMMKQVLLERLGKEETEAKLALLEVCVCVCVSVCVCVCVCVCLCVCVCVSVC